MDGGEIVEIGEGDSFFTDPKTERARSFLSKILAH
jgi:glutamate/aspartate transport system ATP-binding protein